MTPPSVSDDSPVLDFLRGLHGEISGERDGEVASYIPELSRASPDWFGICLVTAGGHVYEVGDTGVPFTIQSVSKPFSYGVALEDNGLDAVLAKIGVEPTGDAFNSISLEEDTGRPRNPMINAGAIATVGMVPGTTPKARERRLLDVFDLFAGRRLEIDEDVYKSESDTGHRNRAIGHMLCNFDILNGASRPVVEVYFRQCAISSTARAAAMAPSACASPVGRPIPGGCGPRRNRLSCRNTGRASRSSSSKVTSPSPPPRRWLMR